MNWVMNANGDEVCGVWVLGSCFWMEVVDMWASGDVLVSYWCIVTLFWRRKALYIAHM